MEEYKVCLCGEPVEDGEPYVITDTIKWHRDHFAEWSLGD